MIKRFSRIPQEVRVTLTVFLTLLFGVVSSVFVSEIAGDHGIKWKEAPHRVELYMLFLIGSFVAVLTRNAWQDEAQNTVSMHQKLDALLSQFASLIQPTPSIGPTISALPHRLPRDLTFSPQAKASLELQSHRAQHKVNSMLTWLQSATASDIVMNRNIRKLASSGDKAFVVRIDGLRVTINLDLKRGTIAVEEIAPYRGG